MIKQTNQNKIFIGRKMLPFLSSWMLLMLIHTTAGFANTPDCNVALETCKDDCTKRPIYDRERGGNVTRTDFVSLCQNACQEAAQWCLKQDSTMSCTTFSYHCESQCPWSVVEYTHQRLQHTDSFRQCESSCSAGATACEPFRKSLPPRKRTGEFDVCPEAQTACYADCVQQMKDLRQDFSIADTNYPDKCAEACAQGVNDCQLLDEAESCDTYEVSCWGSCPSTIADPSGASKSDPQIKQWCRNSCSAGRAYCRSLQNLPFDRNTAPALPTAPAATPQEKSSSETKPAASVPGNTKPTTAPPAAIKPTPENISSCAKAEDYCKDDCRKNKIIVVMNGMWPQRYSNEAETDFWGQCEAACSRAKPGCLEGKGFKTPCQNECPRAYHDKTGNTYPNNDGQNRCGWSCTIGQDAYEGHENENVCQFGYDECEAVCADESDLQGGDDFYKTCEAACKAGENECPNALPLMYCDNFYNTCINGCPESSSDTDAGASCKDACGSGAHKCKERSDVSYE